MIYQIPKFNYKKLEQVLLQLGYVRKKSKYRVYVNDKKDAVLAFPNFHSSKIIDEPRLHHIITNIVGKKVSSLKKFIKLIEQV